MKCEKLLLALTIAVTVVQSSVLFGGAEKNIRAKFTVRDDTDKFISFTLTLSELLETCKSFDVSSFGLIQDHIHRSTWSQTFFNTFTFVQMKYLVLGEYELYVPPRAFAGLHRTKLTAFIVVASNPANLEYMLKRLRNTKWQNPDGLYIVIDGFTVKYRCENASSYLRYAWKLYVLHVAFFCLDANGEIDIYTFNPFTNRAPEPWQEVTVSENGTRNGAWTLYKRKFIRGQTTCADLTFNKAYQLDGYEYKVLAVDRPPGFTINKDATNSANLSGIDSKIHLSFVEYVNASPTFTVLSGVEIGWIEPNGEGRHLLANMTRGEYDIFGNCLYNFNKHQTAMTYPHRFTGLAILTRFAGYQEGQNKILHFMNPKLVGGIAIVAVLTVFVLGILSRYGVIPAILEVAHLLTNSAMTRRIERTPLRIYLIPVFFLFLLSNAAFQCKLSALLTRPLVNPNIQSVEDLRESGLRIFSGADYKVTFNDTLLPNVQFIDDWNCSKYVINEKDTACLADRYEMMKIIIDGRQLDLHLSRQDVLSVTASFFVKPFWPLKERFEEMLGRLFTFGILELWKTQDAQLFVQLNSMYRDILNDRSFRILMIEDLKFAFFLLIIGLVCSTCVFAVECTVSYYKKRNKKATSATFSFVE